MQALPGSVIAGHLGGEILGTFVILTRSLVVRADALRPF
jgi:hypothetical protein